MCQEAGGGSVSEAFKWSWLVVVGVAGLCILYVCMVEGRVEGQDESLFRRFAICKVRDDHNRGHEVLVPTPGMQLLVQVLGRSTGRCGSAKVLEPALVEVL